MLLVAAPVGYNTNVAIRKLDEGYSITYSVAGWPKYRLKCSTPNAAILAMVEHLEECHQDAEASQLFRLFVTI